MDKQAVKAAVESLIETTQYLSIRRAFDELIRTWDKWPTRFAENMAVYNALVDLGRESPDALANVYALVERKRRGVPAAKKVDYQRDYMRQRRVRVNKAIELEEIVRGKPMGADERKAYGIAVLADWMRQRQEMLAKHPEASWKDRNELVGKFWEELEARLDNELEEAHKVLEAPGHRKVRKIDLRQPKGVLGQKLKEALASKRK